MARKSKGFDDAGGAVRRSQALDRLCAMAAGVFKAGTAALVLHQGGVGRIIASAGVAARYRSQRWDFSDVSYEGGDDVMLPNATASPAIRAKLSFLGLDQSGFFGRTPVIAGPTYSLSLVVADREPRPRPGSRQRQLIGEVKALIVAEFRNHAELLTDPASDVTVSLTLKDARREIAESPTPTCLVDANLMIVAANPGMEALLGRSGGLSGANAAMLDLPMAASLTDLCRHALRTRLSPPDFEVVVGGGAAHRVYQLSISPFSPIETRAYFLLVTAREATDLARRERALSRRIGRKAAGDEPPEPTQAFLSETLVERRSIRSRRQVHYLTLRAWRAPIRDWQIKALRALKAHVPPELPEFIATEMQREIGALVGMSAFRAVVPVPCGHSGEGPCLSLEIARALAACAGIPVVQALDARRLKGSSHPKENARRPPLMLARPVTEPVIVVDDVATSGAHIEEAVKLLKPRCGTVLALAWIGGDSA